ncbi:MAG: flagellar biosynthetic protein FliO [Bdellovibrio sp.]|nr:flagellar biosynthetic protein FliO [Bdellovibrio sp.]
MRALGKYVLLFSIPVLTLGTEAWAANVLKQVRVVAAPAKAVDVFLTFDKKVSSQVAEVELLRDFIQITLSDASVYPQKSILVRGKTITKISAYQFSPKIVRCRLAVRGSALAFQGRVETSVVKGAAAEGRILKIRVKAPDTSAPVKEGASTHLQQELEAKSLAPVPAHFQEVEAVDHPTQIAPENQVNAAAGNGKDAPKNPDDARQEQEEKVLLDRVLKASTSEKPLASSGDAEKSDRMPLTGAKPLPSFKGVFIKLGAVTLFALLLGWAVMRARGIKKSTGVLGAIQKMATGALAKMPKNEKMIQVVSTHHIDPKKSIAVVKIAGRLLVLGLSNDSINLITQFGESSDSLSPADLSDSDLTGSFGDLFQNENAKPLKSPFDGRSFHSSNGSSSNSFDSPSEPSLIPSVKSRIKSRLEGLKPL